MISLSYVLGEEPTIKVCESTYDIVSESKELDKLIGMLETTYADFKYESASTSEIIAYEGILDNTVGRLGNWIIGLIKKLIDTIKGIRDKVKEFFWKDKSILQRGQALLKKYPEHSDVIVNDLIPEGKIIAATKSFTELEQELAKFIKNKSTPQKLEDAIDKLNNTVDTLSDDISLMAGEQSAQRTTISKFVNSQTAKMKTLNDSIDQMTKATESIQNDINAINDKVDNNAAGLADTKQLVTKAVTAMNKSIVQVDKLAKDTDANIKKVISELESKTNTNTNTTTSTSTNSTTKNTTNTSTSDNSSTPSLSETYRSLVKDIEKLKKIPNAPANKRKGVKSKIDNAKNAGKINGGEYAALVSLLNKN